MKEYHKNNGIKDHPSKVDKRIAKAIAGNRTEETYERLKKSSKDDYYDY